MIFKTEAEVYRYLLEKEGNMVENIRSKRCITFINGKIHESSPIDGDNGFTNQGLIVGFETPGDWRPLENKKWWWWWEVAEPMKLLMQNRSALGIFAQYVDGAKFPFVDTEGNTWSANAHPVPSSTIREWLAEAERVERECNL